MKSWCATSMELIRPCINCYFQHKDLQELSKVSELPSFPLLISVYR